LREPDPVGRDGHRLLVTWSCPRTLHALIGRIADRLRTPRPDALLITFGWNAGVAATGPRSRLVLVLGVQMLLALRPGALLGHELGHQRNRLTEPARYHPRPSPG
jgi:hypothetical protein